MDSFDPMLIGFHFASTQRRTLFPLLYRSCPIRLGRQDRARVYRPVRPDLGDREAVGCVTSIPLPLVLIGQAEKLIFNSTNIVSFDGAYLGIPLPKEEVENQNTPWPHTDQ